VRLARGLFVAHLLVGVFGVAGMLVALPRPELWADGPGALVFAAGMHWGGAAQNLLGAATLAAFGVAALGWRRTAVFFAASVGLSLAAELTGTATGWPFGEYAYTSGLGAKVAGRVPWTIPLSWFAMGLSAYLLGRALVARLGRPGSALAVVAGAALLVAWDLALDPAMSHPAQRVLFWRWGESGPYLGMPLVNFAGWFATGAAFMTVAHSAWGRPTAEPPLGLPLAVYLANVGFAAVLCAGAGLGLPIALAIGLGAAPALAIAAAPARPPRAAERRRRSPAGA
jgi:putative membrane protein